jgi:GDP-L-fucose synthase
MRERPDYIFLAAAKVGGIHANASRPAEFLYQNLAIEANLIHGAWRAGVQRMLFLGSSCIYPRDCPQPIQESDLLGGPLEATNEPYAIAKIAGLKLCEAYNRQYGTRYSVVMPTNLYGPNDNYDLETSHVAAALLRKAHEAKLARARELVVWGSGTPRREFLHVEDLADACVFLMERGYDGPLLNVGTGEDLPIRDLAALIMRVVGLEARLRFDTTRPDGTPRKLLDVARLHALGWRARIPLADGLRQTYEQFLAAQPHLTLSATATT